MFVEFLKEIKIAFRMVVLFTILTGIIYPFISTELAQITFSWQANGSLVEKNGERIGSSLIGQPFDSPIYFWGRPSATQPYPYNAAASSGSNLGPSNSYLLNAVKQRVQQYKKNNFSFYPMIPVDLVTASGSGLDPDISPLAAYYQVPRVAKARHLLQTTIYELIQSYTIPRKFHILGEPRINILELNLALDKLGKSHNGR